MVTGGLPATSDATKHHPNTRDRSGSPPGAWQMPRPLRGTWPKRVNRNPVRTASGLDQPTAVFGMAGNTHLLPVRTCLYRAEKRPTTTRPESRGYENRNPSPLPIPTQDRGSWQRTPSSPDHPLLATPQCSGIGQRPELTSGLLQAREVGRASTPPGEDHSLGEVRVRGTPATWRRPDTNSITGWDRGRIGGASGVGGRSTQARTGARRVVGHVRFRQQRPPNRSGVPTNQPAPKKRSTSPQNTHPSGDRAATDPSSPIGGKKGAGRHPRCPAFRGATRRGPHDNAIPRCKILARHRPGRTKRNSSSPGLGTMAATEFGQRLIGGRTVRAKHVRDSCRFLLSDHRPHFLLLFP